MGENTIGNLACTAIPLLLVMGSSAWVLADAKRLGVPRPPMWFLLCLAMWIVFFPAYLLKRRRFTSTAPFGTSDALVPPRPAVPWRTAALMSVIGTAGLCGVCVLACLASAWVNTRGIMYYARGTAPEAWVRYVDERGREEELRVALPWHSRAIDLQEGTQVTFSVSRLGEGTVHCRINYDANLLVEHDDENGLAFCAGFPGR